jgi:hypothetical protein
MTFPQARPWGRTAGSLVFVLAALLPIGCSRQKSSQEPTAQAAPDPSEAERLKQQVAQLQAAVSQKDEALAQLHQQPTPPVVASAMPAETAPSVQGTPAPPSAPEPAAQQPIRSVTEQEVVFQLKGCTLSGSLVKCDILVTNRSGDRRLWMGRNERSRMIDDVGRVYPTTEFSLGAENDAYVRMTLPGDVPIEGHIKIDGVKPGTQRIKLLETYCSIEDSTGSRYAVIKFANIDL